MKEAQRFSPALHCTRWKFDFNSAVLPDSSKAFNGPGAVSKHGTGQTFYLGRPAMSFTRGRFLKDFEFGKPNRRTATSALLRPCSTWQAFKLLA